MIDLSHNKHKWIQACSLVWEDNDFTIETVKGFADTVLDAYLKFKGMGENKDKKSERDAKPYHPHQPLDEPKIWKKAFNSLTTSPFYNQLTKIADTLIKDYQKVIGPFENVEKLIATQISGLRTVLILIKSNNLEKSLGLFEDYKQVPALLDEIVKRLEEK